MDFVFDPSLVLYLPLHELDGASFISKDKHGHLCTVTGALWTPQGRSFDGADDLVNCGTSPTTRPAHITLEAWLYHTTVYRNEFSMGQGALNAYNYGIVYETSSGKMLFCFRLAAGWGNRASSRVIQNNTWFHLVGTYDGVNAKTYYNAILDDIQPVTGDINYPSGDTLYLGYALASAHWWTGKIGLVRIYNRALTPGEVQRNYLATKWRYR